MRQKSLIIILLICVSITGYAQDPICTQFYFNSVHTNPSYVGNNHGGTRFNINHRSQWYNIPGMLSSQTFSFDSKFRNTSNIGMLIINDREGEGFINYTGASLYYSHNIIWNKKNIFNAGIGFGYFAKRINWDKFIFYDQLDAIYGKIYNSKIPVPSELLIQSFNDISYGFSWDHSPIKKGSLKYTSLGVSVKYLIPSQNNSYYYYDILPAKWSIHGMGFLGNPYSSNYLINPFFQYLKQGRTHYIDVGCNILINQLICGLGVRTISYQNFKQNINHFIPMIGYKIGEKDIKISYSVDFAVSGMPAATRLTNEITISYIINKHYLMSFGKYNKRRWNPLDCFDFF